MTKPLSDGTKATIIVAAIASAAPTIAAMSAAYIAYKAANKVDTVEVKVDAVKKATDGMTTALVQSAAEKGRAEGAAIATAGAAAASVAQKPIPGEPTSVEIVNPKPVPVVETKHK